jgi:hypothetical protein
MMTGPISLKEAERKVFRTATEDGLWDILIGCVALMFAIAPFLSHRLGDFWSSAIFLPFWGLVYLVILLIRKYVVRPRLGTVTFGQTRRRRLSWWGRVALVANTAMLILGVLVSLYNGILPQWLPTLIFAFIMLSFFSLAAFILDFPRLYFYGVLTALAPLVGEWLYRRLGALHHGFPITFGFVTAVMIISGLVAFVRLLRNNPIPAQGGTAEEQS